eukprot:scaffold1173_cov405-Prasinococcus_capsulatus_cf.AAC.21
MKITEARCCSCLQCEANTWYRWRGGTGTRWRGRGGELVFRRSHLASHCVHVDGRCAVGNNWIVDPTGDEEACATACISVGVSFAGKVSSILQDGMTALEPATLLAMIDAARQLGAARVAQLHDALSERDGTAGVPEELGTG